MIKMITAIPPTTPPTIAPVCESLRTTTVTVAENRSVLDITGPDESAELDVAVRGDAVLGEVTLCTVSDPEKVEVNVDDEAVDWVELDDVDVDDWVDVDDVDVEVDELDEDEEEEELTDDVMVNRAEKLTSVAPEVILIVQSVPSGTPSGTDHWKEPPLGRLDAMFRTMLIFAESPVPRKRDISPVVDGVHYYTKVDFNLKIRSRGDYFTRWWSGNWIVYLSAQLFP
jgi:hypothetical protein